MVDYLSPNFVLSKHPMARCVPETMEGGWRPGMNRGYVIIPNPQTKQIIGKGITVEAAWANAAAILKGIAKLEEDKAAEPAKIPEPPTAKKKVVVVEKVKAVKEEWNSQKKFEEWACYHWGTTTNSIFMKRDPKYANRYLQAPVQDAWDGWQAREEFVPKKRVKK